MWTMQNTNPSTPRRDRRMATTPSPTGLYWSERGAIGCALHTPYERSDTWLWERWMPMTPDDTIDLADMTGQPARCETCGREPTR
jgi:hypothetical protein